MDRVERKSNALSTACLLGITYDTSFSYEPRQTPSERVSQVLSPGTHSQSIIHFANK